MKKAKLIPLLRFVTEVDLPFPIKVDINHECAHRYVEIAKYAKFLNTPLDLDMFYPNIKGELLFDNHPAYTFYKQRVIFENFTVDTHTFSEATSICLDGVLSVFWRDGKAKDWRLSHGLKTVNDLTEFGITYIEK